MTMVNPTPLNGALIASALASAAPPDDSSVQLTPDSLMAYCESRLDSINQQASDSFDSQTRNANETTQIEDAANFIKGFSDTTVTDPKIILSMENKLGSTITDIQSSDPTSAALPKMIQTYNNLVWSGTGGKPDANPSVPDPSNPQFIDPTDYPPDKSTQQADLNYTDTELQGYAQNLSDAANSLNSDSELQMIQLQSLMSQRQTAITLTTNLVQSLGDDESKVVDNIGH